MTDLELLADRYLQNDLSQEERDTLVALLRDDSKKARAFVEALDQRSQMAEAVAQVISARGHQPRPGKAKPIIALLAIAAAVAVAFVALRDTATTPTPDSIRDAAPIARVVGMLHHPDTGEFPIIRNQAFAAGESIFVKSGIIGVETVSGVNLILEEKTIVVFDSPTQIYVKSGQLSVHLPPEMTAFTVLTDTAKIVDRGTEFGVQIDPNSGTDVHVFRGKVGISTKVAPNREHLFERGRCIRVAKASPLAEIDYNPSAFCSQPRHFPIEIFNTGIDLDGERDRHWRTTLPDSNQWHPTIHRSQRKGNAIDSDTSKWIAFSSEALPDDQLYTFQTKFTTDTPMPARLQLTIRTMADDTIESVRLDGVEVWFPDATQRAVPEPWTSEFVEIQVDEMIPTGEHTLEFVTRNFINRQPIRGPNDTGFRAEFSAMLTRPRIRFAD